MNQKALEIKTLMNYMNGTEANTATYVDVSPSASIAKRDMKLIIASQIETAGTFNFNVQECSTTNGTYSTVSGASSIAAVNTNGVSEYPIQPKYRYVRAQITTVTGAGAQGNFFVLLQNAKREA
jgi:hypothetical protein